jgi:ABC-type nitrate/sulfonate/bicarbonate transport system ATPase subunit
MAHRVALARALVTKPNLLLLDEPFVGLDVATRQQMQDLIVKLRAELNLTIVLVTHDLTEAAYVCSRIVIMGRKSPNIREDISVDSAAGTLPTDLSLIARLRTLVHDAAVS